MGGRSRRGRQNSPSLSRTKCDREVCVIFLTSHLNLRVRGDEERSVAAVGRGAGRTGVSARASCILELDLERHRNQCWTITVLFDTYRYIERVRLDERYVCAGAATRALRIDQGSLNQSTPFAVEKTFAGLEIGDATEGTTLGICGST